MFKSAKIVLVIAAVICMGMQCRKFEIEYAHHFSEKIDLYPAQKSYRIGDTIWLEFAKPSKLLYDRISNKMILVDTASIGFSFGVLTPDYSPPNYPANGVCDILTQNGGVITTYKNMDGGILARFGCNSTNTYDFKIGITLKRHGIFSLWIPIAREVAACSNRVEKLPLSDIDFEFGVDCNKDIFLSLPHNIKGFFSGEEIDAKKSFIFYVQ